MVYEQDTPSTIWEVSHKLNTIVPFVECWVETDEITTKILPLEIASKDENTVIITFTRPYAGRACIRNQKRWSDD